MPYNLIDERWLPVRCESGVRRWIAPWEMSDRIDPPLRIDTGRPDFDGALLQFIIGLMQTTAAPADNRAWRRLMDSPPDPASLKETFDTVRYAFDLDADGPRFMQDLTLTARDAEESPIEALLIDSPGEFDHFVKRDRVSWLSKSATAAALLTLQTNAPKGGRGHRTSLRGGGPLTTLVSGPNLFRFVVANVLTISNFRSVPGLHEEFEFPWMKPSRTSEQDRFVDADSAHALEHYWAMPRRIRISFDESTRRCDIYGDVPAAASSFIARPYGTNYKGSFLHPLTPYIAQKDGTYLPRKGRPGAFQYRDWPNIALGTDYSKPAAVVVQYASLRSGENSSIEMFGYDMKDMKPRGFHWATSLLLSESDPEARTRLAFEAEARVRAASYVVSQMLKQLRHAWQGDHPGDAGDMSAYDQQFWLGTESSFFASVEDASIAGASEEARTASREQWLETIHRAALRLFDEHSGARGDATDLTLRNIAIARRDLVRFTHPHGKKIREECRLAAIGRSDEKKKRGKR